MPKEKNNTSNFSKKTEEREEGKEIWRETLQGNINSIFYLSNGRSIAIPFFKRI